MKGKNGGMTQPEYWLRGPVLDVAPLLQPVAHALLQAGEDLQAHLAGLEPEQVWARPGGAASVGYHVRHLAGSLDRLLTYARGELLSADQIAHLKAEGLPGEPPADAASVLATAQAALDRALEQVGRTSEETLLETRRVGRAGLPATVLGLLFHAAEHTTRHTGQAITTAKIVTG
jgi:uncharacterized damage-inducible protein DinB